MQSTAEGRRLENPEEVFENVRERSKGLVQVIDEMRVALEEHCRVLRGRKLADLFAMNPKELREMRLTGRRAERTIRGTRRFLLEDLTQALSSLHDILTEYSRTVDEKMNEESAAEDGSNGVEQARSELGKLAVQINDLERLATTVDVVLNTTAADADKTANESEYVNHCLGWMSSENSDQQPEVDHVEPPTVVVEEPVRGTNDKSQEEEQETLRRRLEEEQLREHEMEKQRMERQRAEDEERQRREEDQLQRTREREEQNNEEDLSNSKVIVYDLSAESDQLGTGIGCAIKQTSDVETIRKSQLECSRVDVSTIRYPVGDFEEIASTLVCLKPADGLDLEFKDTVWVAVPHTGAPRGRVSVIRVQHLMTSSTASEEDKRETVEWHDVTTRDTTVKGQGTGRYVETPLSRLGGGGVHIVVVTRPKRDVDQWNTRGGRLVSSVDSRVAVEATKNTFRTSTDVSLQVIGMDSSALSGLKERYDGCEALLGLSPVICLTVSSRPLKPLLVTITTPSGGNKRSPPSDGQSLGPADGAGSKQRRVSMNDGLMVTGQDDADDVIHLVIRDSAGRWRHKNDVKLEQKRDCVAFKLTEAAQRMILLRTTPVGVASAEIGRLATCLELSLVERSARLVVRQRFDDPTAVFIELCRHEAVDRFVNSDRLKSLGYTGGPDFGQVVCLREGDLLELSFRDNIEPVSTKSSITSNSSTLEQNSLSGSGADQQSPPVRRFVFSSNMASLNFQTTIHERSPYDQRNLDVYRGFVRLHLVERFYQPPPKVPRPTRPGEGRARPASAGAEVTKPTGIAGNAAANRSTLSDVNLVCEVMVTLPKPVKIITKVNKVSFPIAPNGPLTSEFYDELSECLGSEWLKMAEGLGLGQPAIHRIIRNHHDSSPADVIRLSAREALIQWHRSSSKSSNKVDELKRALVEAGRNDLAEELAERNRDHRREADTKHDAGRLKKSLKVFTDSVLAVREWREVGRELGLSPEDLEKIGGPSALGSNVIIKRKPASKSRAGSRSKDFFVAVSPEMRQQATMMLNRWIETKNEEASTEQLVAVLRKLQLNDAAGTIMTIK